MNETLAAPSTTTTVEKAGRNRLPCLDTARGIAIVLVVVGHIIAREPPQDNEWFVIVKYLIYRFHMPFFMTLTGITFGLSLPVFRSWAEVRQFTRKKLVRLLVPYFVVGLIVLSGKFLAVQFVHVDHMPNDFFISMIRLLTAPAQSAVQFLWFIYVLSVFTAAISSFFFAFGFRPVVLLVLSLPLQLFSWPEDFLLNRIIIYLPYFAGGMMLSQYRFLWLDIGLGWGFTVNLIFIILLASSLFMNTPQSVISLASIPAILFLSNVIRGRMENILILFGKRSFSIYLTNNIFIGVTKAILLSFMTWDGRNFLIFLPLLLASGIALPLLVKEFVGKRFPRVNNFV